MFIFLSLHEYQECKDERPDCNWIAQNIKDEGTLNQYCRQYKTVAKQCRKTCNMCEYWMIGKKLFFNSALAR